MCEQLGKDVTAIAEEVYCAITSIKEALIKINNGTEISQEIDEITDCLTELYNQF